MALTKTHNRMIEGSILNVVDFGAKGDGINNDTEAIQAAVNAATVTTPSAVVYFPPNLSSQYYKVTAPIVCTKPITIRGSGTYDVTIIGVGFSAGQAILNLNNAITSTYFYRVEDLTIRSLDSVPDGIRVYNCSYSNFKDINLYTVANGIIITGTVCFSNCFERVSTYANTASGVRFEAFTGGGHYKFDGCTFSAETGFSVHTDSTLDGLNFVNCNFEQCGTNGMYIGGTVLGLSVTGCRTEGQNAGSEFVIRPDAGKEVGGISITGCNFHADGGAVVPIELGGGGGAVRGFSITGNHCGYVANPNFIVLNGDGESGLVAGNFTDYSTTIVNVKRPNVVVFGNEYTTGGGGKNDEAWGLYKWKVEDAYWTPIDSSGAGLSFAGPEGSYQVLGNTIYFWCSVVYPTTSDTSLSLIGGLPETLISSGFSGGLAGASISQTDATLTAILPIASTTTIQLHKSYGVRATNADLSGKVIQFFGQSRIA